MARRGRGVDLETQRELKLVEDLDSVACVLMDKQGTQALNKQIMMVHLAMMAAFITVFLAPFAWIVALLNILMSPKIASWRLESTPHGVKLGRLYTRGETTIQHAKEGGGIGPRPLGLGKAEEARFLAFSEIEEVTWTDYSLRFRMRDGEDVELTLELTGREDIARLGEKLAEINRARTASLTTSAEEADAERRRLARLMQKQPQG